MRLRDRLPGLIPAHAIWLLLAVLLTRPATGQVDFGFGVPKNEPPVFNDSRDEVSASLLPSRTEIPPGADLIVAVVLDADPGWHLWPGPGPIPPPYAVFESAIRTEISMEGTADGAITLHPGFAIWPEVHGVEADLGDGPLNYGVYEGRVGILIPATVSADAKPGPQRISIKLSFQACDDKFCLAPAEETLTTSITVVAAGQTPAGVNHDDDEVFARFDPAVFAAIRGGEAAPQVIDFDVFGLTFSIDAAGGGGFLLLLLIAALGGMLLNFTPCVLPVIPLKIMGLSAAAENRRRCLALGGSMSIGVVFFWMILGAMIAGLKSFQSISELFQFPLFTIVVGGVIVVMAIGMAGFFTIRLPNKVYAVQTSHDTLGGSFVFGIMTAILSTPCTAPLMGAAAAWATTQSPATVLAVFGAIGSGMALPYLVLSAFPDLVKRMPRTGPASEVVKQVMGLLLLAAGLYFVG
ncbi:MAG: cytochrome c biogenesis protein CcdA, partial [Planctomycetota bacterium]|nr:cytochrome c biogenesis protein CcdA [Planctomycetota bacterium]